MPRADLPEQERVSAAMGSEAEADGCRRASEAWESFINTFVDFAVGGHMLPDSARVGSQRNGPNPSPQAATSEENPIHHYKETPDRIVAVGDVHGDLKKTKEALRIAGLIDDWDAWTGGKSVLVQVGDVLDRGGEEIEIIYLLEKLRYEAKKAGGAVHTLLGNHETGSAEGWLRYASKEGLRDFQRWAAWQRWGNAMVDSCCDPKAGIPPRPDPLSTLNPAVPDKLRARLAALMPTGPITSRFLASNPVTLRLGETLFVHGGVLPEHIEYGLDRINKESKEWLTSEPTPEGSPKRAPHFFHTSKAIVWVRDYSHVNPADCDCEKLKRTLGMIPGVSRMVVGHTIQEEGGVNAACGGRVVRVDVGMSRGCGDYAPDVLEILKGEELRVLTRHGPPQALKVHGCETEQERPGIAMLVNDGKRAA